MLNLFHKQTRNILESNNALVYWRFLGLPLSSFVFILCILFSISFPLYLSLSHTHTLHMHTYLDLVITECHSRSLQLTIILIEIQLKIHQKCLRLHNISQRNVKRNKTQNIRFFLSLSLSFCRDFFHCDWMEHAEHKHKKRVQWTICCSMKCVRKWFLSGTQIMCRIQRLDSRDLYERASSQKHVLYDYTHMI